MAELAHPLWLLALALVPWMRWLHGLRAPGRPRVVPALFLWREAAAAASAGPRRGPPDPAWRRRALLAALVVLALAGPRWTSPGVPAVEVWIDDGPALFAREPGGGDRLAQAARALSAALAEAGAREAALRTLHRPGERLDLAAGGPAAIETGLRDWLRGPGADPLSPPAALAGGAPERWLLGTGADPRTREALSAVPFARAIPVGTAGTSQALVHLSLRPSLADPSRLAGLAQVWNPGARPAGRTVRIRHAGVQVAEAALTIPPGDSAGLGFSLPAATMGTVTAALHPDPDDTLPLDDRLDLALAGPVPTALEGDCGPALRTALEAHPGLRVGAPDPGLRVLCAAEPGLDGPPVLWIVSGPAAPPAADPPLWIADGSAAPLLPGAAVGAVAPPGTAAGRVLMAVGDRPLALEQDRPRRIALLLDPEALGDRPELPALLARLLDRLAGRDLLAGATVRRDPDAARVAPGPLPAPRGPAALPAAPAPAREASPWLLAAALGLALHDLARRAREGRAT